jgi:hypothetical protein
MSRIPANIGDITSLLQLLQGQVEQLQDQTSRLQKILAYGKKIG